MQKLERLLELPAAFSLQKARVLVLRVTIPMDFYTSPITAEVDGVDISLKVASKPENDQQHSRKRRKGAGADDAVPTAADLAQSFLQTQPVEETKELEEALMAETQDLGASVAISEPESDDGSTFGTGQALSLPAFLTDFLQGIVDRMQVKIRGVTFQVNLEVPIAANAPTPELVTFQLAMDNISVEGVTTPGQAAEGGPTIVPKDGKRHILLDNIRAFLISEANVLSSLAPSPSMPASVASQSPSTAEAPTFPDLGTGFEGDAASDPMADSDYLAQSTYPLQDSEDAFNIPYDLEEDKDERKTGDAVEPSSSLSTPRASVYQDSIHQDFVQGSVHDEGFEGSVPHGSVDGSTRHGFSPPAVRQQAKSTVVEAAPLPWSTLGREAQSEPFLRPPLDFSPPKTPSPQASVHSASASSSSSGVEAEDLTQSHLYSHEEAESMYMSAFSQAESDKLRGSMPGSWDADEVAPSAKSSPQRTVADSTTSSGATSSSPEHDDSNSDGEDSSNLVGRSPQHPTTDRLATHENSNHLDADDDAVYRHTQHPATQDEPEAPQEDIPTPRGPTRLVKEILSLSSVSIYLPSTHGHIQVTPDLGKSIPQNLPGAFSIHSATATSPSLLPIGDHGTEKAPLDKSIEIILKPLDVRFDASIGFLLTMVISRLLEAVQGQPSESSASAPSKPSSTASEIKLSAEQLSIHFLEKLAGVADTAERLLDKRTADFSSDVLLQAQIVDLQGSISISDSQTDASIGVERFRFGYANDDIISFDRSVQLFESVVSTVPSSGQDISVKVTSGPEISRVEISTLPLHVKLDLPRLDETFSWFGGLSSFLNMGSSVTSSTPKVAKSAAKSAQKPRGVRFEALVESDDRTASKENKTDLRINGILLDVVGKDCSLTLNSSALKLVSREKGIGIHLSRIRLSGPHIRNSRADAPIVAEIVDTRLDYAMLPRTQDLERLLELITPSKIKFDENEDEIMVDTLLRQRKKGPVLSLTVGKVRVDASSLQQLSCLPSLADDLAKLGIVAKYLPEDDRPGLLTLCHVKDIESSIELGGRLGVIQVSLIDLVVAHITVPALVAVAVGGAAVTRNKIEELVGTAPVPATASSQKPPVVMMRLIDDIEPVLKVNLIGLSLEYRVPTIMDVLDLAEDATPQDFEASLAASVANLGDQAHAAIKRVPSAPLSSVEQVKASKAIKVDVAFRDCLIGLNPLGIPSKLTVVLTESHLEVTPGKRDRLDAAATMNKASVLLVDDISILESTGAPFASTRRPQIAPSPQVTELCSKGYVNICQISSARAAVRVFRHEDEGTQLEVEVRDDLLVLETCADSTQTLIALANALKPPTPPSKEIKYRTSVVPVQDLLASITADAFGRAEGDYDFDNDFAIADELAGPVPEDAGSEDDFYGGQSDSPLDLHSQYYEEAAVQEELFDATNQSVVAEGPKIEDTSDGVLLSTASLGTGSSISIHDDYFEQRLAVQGTAHRWNSKKNTYDNSNDSKVQRSPLKVSVRDVHVIWHLFDGYDWARTREVIAKAVQDVEAKAYERRARAGRRGDYEQDPDEDETVIGDFLFNSIYIGIPANRDPKELAQAINQDLQDVETASVATTAVTTTTVRAPGQHRRSKSLKLNRSKRHKITFELTGVNVDLVIFPPDSGETVSSIDLKVRDLDIFDHVPESTWKKFAMYDFDAGERELGASMVHIELLNTKPVPSMPASEIVMNVNILPLRLHVDQDALDFITRFFEFKDESVPIHASQSDVPFIQRVEVKDIPVKLDFKPKRVDYAGLRSGHTTEFMNFMILEDARMVLRRVILYGVSGFDRLGKQLNDVWMDDVKRTQLPGILAGLAPVRSLVNAGSGFRDLIEIPIREYRKDGRIVRSVRKGATAFAKTTGTEVVKLGAKLAIGTQNVLQGAEGLFVANPSGEGSSSAAGEEWEDTGYDEERHRKISPYAHQPLGIFQGVRGAYASLARDLSMARDAIIAVPAEVMESQSAQGAAKAVLKKAPTIIFRPAIGATKAIGQTLLGATNSLDPQNRRRAEAVSHDSRLLILVSLKVVLTARQKYKKY
jgi:autophagy-related protein 2